jgi:hypothetical protein
MSPRPWQPQRIVFPLLVLGAGYAVLEGGARLLLPPPYPFNPNSRVVEETPHLSPGRSFTIVTNNFGFRNSPDFAFPWSGQRPRLLLIGDSLIFGGPNDRTLDQALSRLLPGQDVLNGGSPGADIAFYGQMVRYYLPRIRPSRLVVGLFLGNDFSGPSAEQRAALRYRVGRVLKGAFPQAVLLRRRLAVERGARVARAPAPPLEGAAFRARVAEEVRTLCKGRSLDLARQLEEAAAYPYEAVLDEHPGLQTEAGTRIVAYAIVDRAHLAESLRLDNDNARLNYDAAWRELRALRDFAARQSVEPLFVLFPVSFMVDARYAAFYRDLGYAIPAASARYPLRDRLRTDLQAAGYAALDLQDHLADAGVFFDQDWHLNERGNDWAAAEIARRLAGAEGPLSP